ncbi:PREDICTED: limulus clotting factor C-like [Polistes dominula]|uniref:Limulus clotting factor C-like n=1 Tax=Polistes dominula TaxID=743375 RepID=A0ABM1IGM8_POLDO|nr:PREDICTED: limulus clotting factor C-like [Polistes dominula]
MEIVDKMCLFLIALGFFLTFIQPTSGEEKANTCLAPPEPKNGIRKLRNLETYALSDVQEGAELPIGSSLEYECNPGSQIWGSSPVICGSNGNWNNIPVCKKILCKSLVSRSVDAVCTLNGKIVSCKSPILHGTLAVLSCRYGFYEDEHDLSTRSNQVKCNERGKWEPEPMQCLSACGVVQHNIQPLTIIKVPRTENSDFPWHASLYEQKTPNGSKDFICGATIITEKLLLTAAHCVYNETNRRTQNPDKYYVAAGNTNRDYDYNQQLVEKSKVKNIYINKAYFGYEGNLAGDIAILEIETPFTFSPLLLPVCWDDTIIDSGLGKMAGFRRTISGENSFALQSATFPYVRLDQCKSLDNSIESERYKTKDKFCVGYTNG